MALPALTRKQKGSATETIMRLFCRREDEHDYAGGTAKTTLDNSLDFLLKCVPDFVEMARGKRVLDFGCGFGYQATTLVRDHGCQVTGVDLPRENLAWHWGRMREIAPVHLTTDLPPGEQFDLVYSCSAFEHFSDPEAILRLMIERTKPGGRIVVAFAEPWYSPRGSHMDGFCKLPWVNLLFSEATVMRVRSRYRTDGATRYEDVDGGLNRMTVRRFERIIGKCGMHVEQQRLIAVKELHLVTHVPVVRELLTAACAVVLRKP